MTRWLRLVVAAGCAAVLGAHAQTEVAFDSLDRHGGQVVTLKAWWFGVDRRQAPAVVLLHGCSGPYDHRGRLGARMREYAELFNRQGMHALVVDSLTPRGETELCTQRIGTRQVTQANRRLDALASLHWLAQRPDVDAQRLGLVGWSNGGSTVLSATNLRQREVREAPLRPAFAVAFYPGCEADLRRGYQPSTPLLVLVGEADDWTAAAPCQALAAQAAQSSLDSGAHSPAVQIEAYAGAYHGFDSHAPVRVRKEVPNGLHPGEGVHVGGNPEALQRSQQRLLEFIAPWVNR
jgi:dienelactone hydrolase